jgi:chromosome partitioning protein
MKIITFGSLKGGVGKTTCAAFLAHALSSRGTRVLVVDIDANNNLTDYFLRDTKAEDLEARNVRHILADRMNPAEAVHKSSHDIDVIPATPELHSVGIELASDPGALLRFPVDLRQLDYDFIVIDSPPALVVELRAALYAADLVLVPIAFSRWTIAGFRLLRRELVKVAKSTGTEPDLRALPSCVTEKEAEHLRNIDSWCSTETAIFRSASVKAASSSGRILKEGSKPWENFRALADEVMK